MSKEQQNLLRDLDAIKYFLSFFFKLEYDCFTTFVLYKMSISHTQTYINSLLSLSSTSHPLPTPLELRSLCYNMAASPSLFSRGRIYMSVRLSQFIPPSSSASKSTSLFFMFAPLFLPGKQVYQQHLFYQQILCIYMC